MHAVRHEHGCAAAVLGKHLADGHAFINGHGKNLLILFRGCSPPGGAASLALFTHHFILQQNSKESKCFARGNRARGIRASNIGNTEPGEDSQGKGWGFAKQIPRLLTTPCVCV